MRVSLSGFASAVILLEFAVLSLLQAQAQTGSLHRVQTPSPPAIEVC